MTEDENIHSLDTANASTTSSNNDDAAAKLALGKELRKARYLTLTGSPISDEANKLVDHLTARILEGARPGAPWKEAGPVRVRRALGALLSDLFFAQQTELALWSYRPQASNSFTGEEVGYRAYLRVRGGLEKLDLIETLGGFNPRGAFALRGWTTRLRGTPALFAMAETFGVDVYCSDNHFRKGLPTTVLELREPADTKNKRVSGNTPGKRKKYTETYATRRLAMEVREINTFLAGRDIRGCTHNGFRRIFRYAPKFNWNKHGRLYSAGADSYQQLPKEKRRRIRIDGEAVTELDIRACSLTIAHALMKEPLDNAVDPYDIQPLPRGVAKLWITMTLGHTEFHKRWTADAVKRFAEENPGARGSTLGKRYPIKEVERLVLQRHPLLGRLHQHGITTLDLMFNESEIIVQTLLRLIRQHQIPALPIHDSLIVRERDAKEAHIVLEQEFNRLLGVVPYIRIGQ